MRAKTEATTAYAAEQAPGDWNATVALAHLEQRLDSMEAGGSVLCFGRLDHDHGDPLYIGRRHVEDGTGDPVVVDWRAPVSIPFYRATFSDPMDLHRRRRFSAEHRRLVDIFDEYLDDPESTGGGGVPDPLLAELERARTGAMRDIVGTIQAEQDVVIRAPLDRVVIVQGGPGTGKTAVGLHRAAFLLFEHRGQLQRDGVLVIGPNPVFLRYIAEVLPSLGETAVVQTTILGLAGRFVVRAGDDSLVAAIKGDARMATVIDRACRAGIRPLSEDLRIRTRWGSAVLDKDEVNALLVRAQERAATLGNGRDAFRLEVHRLAHRLLSRDRADFLVDRTQVEVELRDDAGFRRALDRAWPRASAAAVVRRLLTSRTAMADAATGTLSRDEQQALLRRAGPSIDREPWTAGDIPLLDEAEHRFNGTGRRYGHIVVDEAQDLSPMAIRMLARRTMAVPSMTILGDLAQATAPAGQQRWEDVLDQLGRPERSSIEELAIGYRVPAQILDLANRLLAVAAPDLRPSRSIRTTPQLPRIIEVDDPAELGARVAAEVMEVAARWVSIGVIAPEGRTESLRQALATAGIPASVAVAGPSETSVVVLTPVEAKGLEFDAVIVVDPAGILAITPAGARHLYVALTRAVQHLSVIHLGPLPGVLGDHAPGETVAATFIP
jgi:DNA helicase IV